MSDVARKPEFLGIGAAKAATTWLHVQLSHHPQLWLPPLKEIQYFNRGPQPYVLEVLRRDHRRRWLLWRWLRPALADALRHPRRTGWYARYFLQRRSDRWYQALFAPAGARVSGEITPGYGRLDAAGVRRVHTLLPDARILYMLRHPADRIWSHAAMYFSRYGQRGLAQASPAELAAFLDSEPARRNSDYLTTLALWRAVYPAERLFVGFYEQVAREPHVLLNDLCRFLQMDDTFFSAVTPDRHKIHARSYPPMPRWVAETLHARYDPQVQTLHEWLNSPYTAEWLARAAP